MIEVEKNIEEKIKKFWPSAKHFSIQNIVDDFASYSVFYIEFDCKELTYEDSYCYVVVGNNGEVKLYDDGVEAIEKLKQVLDKRRSFLQRLNEFSLFELISGLIAISVTTVFVYLSFIQQQLNKDLVGIFGIIVGYYFGKNISK